MPKKQTSPELSTLAAKVLGSKKPEWMRKSYWTKVRKLAASVLSQDETKGRRSRG